MRVAARAALLWLVRASLATAQSTTSESITVTEDNGEQSQTYLSYSTTITMATTTPSAATTSNAAAQTTNLSEEGNLVGTYTSTMNNSTTTGSMVPGPMNLQPCNGYVELCGRNYSNVTFVGAHNSPFARRNNAASNQRYPVLAQLNDGIRMLQGQTQMKNGVPHYCHTSCDLLDAGPAIDYFANITRWLSAADNRFEVVTVLIGNGNYSDVGNFTGPLHDSGLIDYAYVPPKIPMGRYDWPTMSHLIETNKRAVIFMDYQANQTAVPYILDEFSQMWETPFDPQNDSFPCTVQRPPDLKEEGAQSRLYMLNNNLNVPIGLLGADILVPNTVQINTTNGLTGDGSLGASTNGCVADWGRPPNFLLVDFYNEGSYPGSIFQVAARANNVTFKNGSCCGLDENVSWAVLGFSVNAMVLYLASAFAATLLLL